MLEMDFLRRENGKIHDRNRNNATMHARNELFETRKLEKYDKFRTKFEIMLLCMLEMNVVRRENWKNVTKFGQNSK